MSEKNNSPTEPLELQFPTDLFKEEPETPTSSERSSNQDATEPSLANELLADATDTFYEHTPESYAYAEEAHKDFDDSDPQPEQKEEIKGPRTFREILATPLPTALSRRVFMQYVAAIAIVLFCIVLTIYQRDPRYLFAIVISGGLVYMAIATTLDFVHGKIVELAVLCAEVNELALRNKTLVVFRTNEEIPTYFEFYLPGKRGREFRPNAVYFIYFDPHRPHILLGHANA